MRFIVHQHIRRTTAGLAVDAGTKAGPLEGAAVIGHAAFNKSVNDGHVAEAVLQIDAAPGRGACAFAVSEKRRTRAGRMRVQSAAV